MDRSGSLRFILIGVAAVFAFLLMQKLTGGEHASHQPLGRESQVVATPRAAESVCDVWTPSFHARLRSHGGALTHFQLLGAKYRKGAVPFEVSTTPDPSGDHEFRQQLFTRFRGEGPEDPSVPWNATVDSLDFELTRSDGKACEFTYRDPRLEVRKTVSATERPYELLVQHTITNRADRPLKHAVSVDTVAWRTTQEVEGKMFRISPYITHVECVSDQGDAVRLAPSDFEPSKFAEEPFAKSDSNPFGSWHRARGKPAFAAVTNAYFSSAVAAVSGATQPECLLQIEQRWDGSRYESPAADPNGGAMYRARLSYAAKVLPPGESAEYTVLSFVGPKEREILSNAGGGNHRLLELIDLGFFSAIAKILVAFLLKVHSVLPNWGIAIIVLTITARVLLFPLSLPGIKNMVRMREIKPEMDALNARYKDDPQARGLAQMELWRKHNVNPFKGCLPQLASMPVWFALYTTLQTAVELYNIPFLWFPDLSQSDPLFILPFVIGGTYFVQQKMMPMQGGDPVQQKMMMYMMPGMFTVFMLFLPAGLGIYMFTNSVLAITQQWAVERYAKRTLGPGGGQIAVKIKDEPSGSATRKDRKDSKRKGGDADAERLLPNGDRHD